MKTKFNVTQIMTMKTKRNVTWFVCVCVCVLFLFSKSQFHLVNVTRVWYVERIATISHMIRNIMMRFANDREQWTSSFVCVTFFVSFCLFSWCFLFCAQTPGAFAAFVSLNDRVKIQDEWKKKKTCFQSILFTTVSRLNGVLNQGLSVRSSEQWHSMIMIIIVLQPRANVVCIFFFFFWFWPIYWQLQFAQKNRTVHSQHSTVQID